MPESAQFHLSVKLVGSFRGSTSHLVTNVGAGVIAYITRRCGLFDNSQRRYSSMDLPMSHGGHLLGSSTTYCTTIRFGTDDSDVDTAYVTLKL